MRVGSHQVTWLPVCKLSVWNGYEVCTWSSQMASLGAELISWLHYQLLLKTDVYSQSFKLFLSLFGSWPSLSVTLLAFPSGFFTTSFLVLALAHVTCITPFLPSLFCPSIPSFVSFLLSPLLFPIFCLKIIII